MYLYFPLNFTVNAKSYDTFATSRYNIAKHHFRFVKYCMYKRPLAGILSATAH